MPIEPSYADEGDDLPPESSPEPQEDTSAQGPPAILSLPRAELVEVHRSARLYAIKKLKSKVRAEELVSDVFHKLMTTRRFDPAKGPLLPYVIAIIKSEISHRSESKAPERERLAAEGFYREQQRARTASAEDTVIDATEAANRIREAGAELTELERRISHHPIMAKVLACRAEDMTPAETAQALGVPIADVYSAIKQIKGHLARMRASREEGTS